MATPSSGQICWSDIQAEIGGGYCMSDFNTSTGRGYCAGDYYNYSPSTTININTALPAYVGCYNYYGFTAFTSTPVNTNVTVTIYWYGDLGGQFNGTVIIYAGTTCGDNYSIYSGGGIYCGGEYYNFSAVYASPSTSGGQIYEPGYNTPEGTIACV